MKAYFLIYIGDFNCFSLEYPIFLPIYKHLDLKTKSCIYNYWRLTTDSNLLSWIVEPLVLMEFEPIRDNGRNIISFSV